MAPRRVITDSDLPQLFQAADRASKEAQTQYTHGTRARLVFVVLAAAAGVSSWTLRGSNIDILGLASVCFFIGALVLESTLWKSRPDRIWYDARAVAESTKTLAWKFAVGAEPFPSSLADRESVGVLMDRLEVVRIQFRHLDLAPVESKMVTTWMATQRQADWDDRRAVYLNSRLRGQERWYALRAAYNRKRSNQWRLALVVLEIAGAGGALAEALFPSVPALTPTIAAVIGAVVAWVETKNHDVNSRAYATAVSDLAKAEAKLEVVTSEADWAIEVNDAEDAISREHTLWLASRSQL